MGIVKLQAKGRPCLVNAMESRKDDIRMNTFAHDMPIHIEYLECTLYVHAKNVTENQKIYTNKYNLKVSEV